VAGLITRSLASRCGIGDVEEAFICGMLHELGRTLTMFYFGDDHADICQLVTQGSDEDEAVRTVLGVRYPELGYAIAREWAFPEIILYSMADHQMKVTLPGAPHAETLRCLTVFANTLIRRAVRDEASVPNLDELRQLLDDVQPCIPLTAAHVLTLFGSAVDKFRQFAPVLDVDAGHSEFLRHASLWLGALQKQTGPAAEEIPAGQLLLVCPIPLHRAPDEPGSAPQGGEWTREAERLLDTGTD
jgi:hypothetical protein